MQAYLTEPPGGWEACRYADVPLRAGQDDEVLVRIRAVGLNPADAFLIEGRYPGGPKPPFVCGRDAAGEVLQGDRNGLWQPGDNVVVLQSTSTNLREGTLAEQQWISAGNLSPLPADWSFAEAAAAPLVYQTAWKCLVGPGTVSAGQVVLVTGASGGVGLAAVHLAKGLGATVIALSRSIKKQEQLRAQGADFAFSPSDEKLKEQIAQATNRKGIDIVVETVGGPFVTQAVHLLGIDGRVSCVGVLAGIESAVPIPALMFKRASIHGILVTEDDAPTAQAAWKQIIDILQKTGRRPVIDSRFPFSETRAAFQQLRSDVFGKVVVEIG